MSVEAASYTIIGFSGKDLPAAYRNLIFSRWLRSLRFSNDYFNLIEANAYYAVYHRYIEALLARPATSVNLAVLSDDNDNVLGFSVTEPEILHYVHVHKYQRKQGIGRALVPSTTRVITHVTKTGLSLWVSKMPQAVFNPFA